MRTRRQRAGGAAIEFGLWLPVIMAMLSGIVDVSWMMSRYHQVVRAARDGARVGVAIIEADDVAYGSEITAASTAHAEALLDGVGMTCDSDCTVTSTIITDGGLDYLEVEVQYEYEPLMNMVPLETTLQSRFTMMLQQQD